MKLSEAMRLGATLAPQIKGIRHTIEGGACALGQSELAVGQKYKFDRYGKVDTTCISDGSYRCAEVYWTILDTATRHPIHGRELKVAYIIADLNNDYGWTTNQIADWVETQENAMEQAKSLPAVSPASEALASVG
jgi:hypothetical protein